MNNRIQLGHRKDFTSPYSEFQISKFSNSGNLISFAGGDSNFCGSYLSSSENLPQRIETVVFHIGNQTMAIKENTFILTPSDFTTSLALNFNFFTKEELEEWDLLDKYLPISRRMFGGKRRLFKL